MSQTSDILDYMRRGGTLTPLDALIRFQCFRLGARIYDLRKSGHNIRSTPHRLPSGKMVSKYCIESEAA